MSLTYKYHVSFPTQNSAREAVEQAHKALAGLKEAVSIEILDNGVLLCELMKLESGIKGFFTPAGTGDGNVEQALTDLDIPHTEAD